MNCWQTLTDMISFEDVASELNKKYRDTWLKVESPTHPTKFGVFHGQHNEDDFVFKNFHGNDTFVEFIKFNHDPTISISIPKPDLGCYTSMNNKKLVVFSNLPHRQWKRGLCQGNASISDVVESYRIGNSNGFNEHILSVLNPKESNTLEEALEFLDKEEYYGCAINRSFGITLNFTTINDSFVLLFYKQYLIGKVLRKKKRILLENDLFLQELIDTKHNWCADYEVILNG